MVTKDEAPKKKAEETLDAGELCCNNCIDGYEMEKTTD